MLRHRRVNLWLLNALMRWAAMMKTALLVLASRWIHTVLSGGIAYLLALYRCGYQELSAFSGSSSEAAASQIAPQALIAAAKSEPIFFNVFISDEACFSTSATGFDSDD